VGQLCTMASATTPVWISTDTNVGGFAAIATAGGGAGGWVKVYDQQLSAAGLFPTISGLDLDTHGFYKLLISVANTSGVNKSLDMWFNGDKNSINYLQQQMWIDGSSTANIQRLAGSRIAYMENNHTALVEILIHRGPDGSGSLGYPKALIEASPNGMDVRIEKYSTLWTSKTNVTSIDIELESASNAAAGSRVILLRPE